MERVGSLLTKFRLFVLIIILGISAVLLFYAVKLPVKISLEKLFPYNHPFVQLNKDLGTKFGGANTMLVMVKSKKGSIYTPEMLDEIKRISDYFTYKPYSVMSLVVSVSMQKAKYTRASGMDVLEIKPVFAADFDNTEKSFEFAKQMTHESGVFQGLLVSDDDSSALVIVEVKDDANYMLLGNDISDLKSDLAKKGIAEISISGRPILLSRIYKLGGEITYLVIVGLIVSIILLYVLYQNVYGVIIIITSTILCAIWGLGLMSIMNFELSPLLLILPILVSARAVSHSLQIYSRYTEEYVNSKSDSLLAMKNTIKIMMIPNWSAVGADVFGFFILYLIKITIIQEIAISMGIWVLTLAIIAGVFLPAFASYLPCKIAKSGFLDRISYRMCAFSVSKRGTIIVVGLSAIILVFSSIYAKNIQIGDEFPGSSLLFPKDQYNVDTKNINGSFSKAGADGLLLFFQGTENDALKDPEVLQYFDRFERNLMKKMPDVAEGAWSLVTILKKINMELHGGDPKWALIPDTKAMCANLIFMFSMKNDPTEFSRYTDPTYKIGNTVIFFKDHTPSTIQRMDAVCNDFFKAYPPKLNKIGEFKYAGGSMGLEAATSNVVETSHIKIDIYVLVAILVLCIATYRSFVAGILITLPLLAANVIVTGAMAFMHIGLTIDTLPVVAIGVGIGADFGIYLFSRIVEEMEAAGNNFEVAIQKTFLTTGKTILFSGVTMIIPLYIIGILTKIKFQAQIGILIGTILTINMLWALTIQPICAYYFKPKFLYKKSTRESVSQIAAEPEAIK